LKKEYAIEDTWVSYELHPETPPAGVLLSERFKGYDLSSFHEQLRARGEEVGVVFGNLALLSNSRSALMAAEFARDLGLYDSFHENMFQAYFTNGLDIGNPDVIADIAGKSGLAEKETLSAIRDSRYQPRLDEARREGQLLGLTGIPLFIIENKYHGYESQSKLQNSYPPPRGIVQLADSAALRFRNRSFTNKIVGAQSIEVFRNLLDKIK
jgi:predicted DsbA family dithiol-disulfide isomerase